MKYVSTRRLVDDDDDGGVSFQEAIFQGYAPDGGLFVPTQLPTITQNEIQSWASLSYTQLTFHVLRKFICQMEISDDSLLQICLDAFAVWYHKDIIPVVTLLSDNNAAAADVHVSELFHGPTHCFKDLGMIMVILLLQHFATCQKKKITLLVSTTGDTGPAAVHAVRRLSSDAAIHIIVHFPKGQISKFQQLQLTTQISYPQVTVVSFEGGGDDMDTPIKNILTSQGKHNTNNTLSSSSSHSCTGVNSYNIARPIMQAVHYIWTYLRVIEKTGTIGDPDVKVHFVLPTGAMGNIAGGYMAKRMGVPIGMLCAGVNANDITHRTFQTGKFHKSDMKKTLSDAINIQVPYNFERLLYYLANEDPDQVRRWMEKVDSTDKLDLDATWLARLQMDFQRARIDDKEMCQTLVEVRDKYGYLADPHTAVALAAAKKLGYFHPSSSNNSLCLCAVLATASPCKFEESVTAAIGVHGWQNYCTSNDFPDHAKAILDLEEKSVVEYKWGEGADINAVQAEWEIKLRKMIIDVSSPGGACNSA